MGHSMAETLELAPISGVTGMTRSLEALNEVQAPDEFEYQGRRFWLHPYLFEYGKPTCLNSFRSFTGGVLEVMRQTERMRPNRQPGKDLTKAFIKKMRGTKRGRPWMAYDPAIDQIPFAFWFLQRWISYLESK